MAQSDAELKEEESYREYLCRNVYEECGFGVRAKTEDEVIEHAHMHQELAHNVKETMPEAKERIKAEIRPAGTGMV